MHVMEWIAKSYFIKIKEWGLKKKIIKKNHWANVSIANSSLLYWHDLLKKKLYIEKKLLGRHFIFTHYPIGDLEFQTFF